MGDSAHTNLKIRMGRISHTNLKIRMGDSAHTTNHTAPGMTICDQKCVSKYSGNANSIVSNFPNRDTRKSGTDKIYA